MVLSFSQFSNYSAFVSWYWPWQKAHWSVDFTPGQLLVGFRPVLGYEGTRQCHPVTRSDEVPEPKPEDEDGDDGPYEGRSAEAVGAEVACGVRRRPQELADGFQKLGGKKCFVKENELR